MSELLCDLTIVGEHKYTCSILVETAYWEYSCRASLEKIHYGLVCVWIAGCSYEALRLVHYDIDLILALETLTVEADVVCVDVYLCTELSNNLAVYCNHTCEDEVVSLSSRAYARVRDELIETDLVLDWNCYCVVVRISVVVELRSSADHLVDSALILITEVAEILLVEALLCCVEAASSSWLSSTEASSL